MVTLWPLFDLRVETPRLTLVYPTDAQIDRLARLAAGGIHDDDAMPFSFPWTRQEPLQLQRSTLQYHWLQRGQWKPEAWELPLVAMVDGEVVGTQSVSGRSFSVVRAVETGSWLGRASQGRGIGTEMRAAVLHLAFAGLGAVVAYTSAFVDNPASQGVNRALGYVANGTRRVEREGKPALMVHFQLTREAWEQRRREDIRIFGLEGCLELFGAEVS